MKIHIDTSTAEEAAKAQKVKGQPSTKGKPQSGQQQKPANASASGSPSGQPSSQPKKPTKPLTTKPPKEPKAPQDVADARKQQTAVLKARQQRETQGKTNGFQRDADVGAGFWPPVALW